MFFSDFYKFKVSVFIIVELDSSSDFYQGSPGWSHRTYTHCLKNSCSDKTDEWESLFQWWEKLDFISEGIWGWEGLLSFYWMLLCISEVAQSCPTLCDPMAYQAPPSMEFSRQEYWSGLPFPSPGDLPDPGIEPGSPALQADALPSKSPGRPFIY